MSTTDRLARTESELQQMAKDHLWMHFARQSVMTEGAGVPIIVKGEGHHIWDSQGKRYIDGLAGLFVVARNSTFTFNSPSPHPIVTAATWYS